MNRLEFDHNNPYINDKYGLLCEQLHNTDFKWTIISDHDRQVSGEYYRYLFVVDNDLDETVIRNFNSTLLEVIVSLVDRLREISYKDIDWFYEILNNTGLYYFDNDQYIDNLCEANDQVGFILSKILNREYKKNGYGGFFPIKKIEKDLRKTSLWMQMEYYVQYHDL